MPLPDPALYDTWQGWARAVTASLVLDETSTTPSGTGPGGGGSGGASLPIKDNQGRPIVTDAGLWIYRDGGRPPISPDLFSIDTLDIADAAIVTSKMGPQAVTNDILADLAVDARALALAAVGEGQLADGAVSELKIGLLAVGGAAIQDLAVGTAKIAEAAIVEAKIGNAAITNAKIADAAINRAKIANAAIGSAEIEDAAITRLKVGLAAIDSARIADAAITRAKIGTAAVGSAEIEDAAITNAKVLNLTVTKLISGALNAIIQVGGGRFDFTVGGGTLMLGNGFGSVGQFFLWYGPTVAVGSMTEANATVFLKVNGDAYFGGALRSGVLRTAVQNPSTSPTAVVETGQFGTNGNPILVTTSLTFGANYTFNYNADGPGRAAFEAKAAEYGATEGNGWQGSKTVAGGATVVLARSWNGAAFADVTSFNVGTGIEYFSGSAPEPSDGVPGYANFSASYGSSLTYTDAGAGAGTRNFQARITSRSGTTNTQRLSLSTVED